MIDLLNINGILSTQFSDESKICTSKKFATFMTHLDAFDAFSNAF